jgi:hypothetical protein
MPGSADIQPRLDTILTVSWSSEPQLWNSRSSQDWAQSSDGHSSKFVTFYTLASFAGGCRKLISVCVTLFETSLFFNDLRHVFTPRKISGFAAPAAATMESSRASRLERRCEVKHKPRL